MHHVDRHAGRDRQHLAMRRQLAAVGAELHLEIRLVALVGDGVGAHAHHLRPHAAIGGGVIREHIRRGALPHMDKADVGRFHAHGDEHLGVGRHDFQDRLAGLRHAADGGHQHAVDDAVDGRRDVAPAHLILLALDRAGQGARLGFVFAALRAPLAAHARFDFAGLRLRFGQGGQQARHGAAQAVEFRTLLLHALLRVQVVAARTGALLEQPLLDGQAFHADLETRLELGDAAVRLGQLAAPARHAFAGGRRGRSELALAVAPQLRFLGDAVRALPAAMPARSGACRPSAARPGAPCPPARPGGFCTLAPRLASYWAVSRRSSKSPRCTCWPGCTSISRTMPPSRLCTSCRCDGGVMAPRPFTDTSSWANVAQAKVSTNSTAISASMRMTRRRGSRSGSGCACGKGRAFRGAHAGAPVVLSTATAAGRLGALSVQDAQHLVARAVGHDAATVEDDQADPPAPAWPCGA